MKTIIISFDFMTLRSLIPTNPLSFLATLCYYSHPLIFPPYCPWYSFSLYWHISLPSAPQLIATQIGWLVIEDSSGLSPCLQIRSHQKTALPRWAPCWACAHSLVSSSPEARGSWVSCSADSYHCTTSVSSGPVAFHDGTKNQMGTIFGLSGCQLL